MGAKILGISKDIITKPSLYKTLKLDKKIKTKFIDIKDYKKIEKIFSKFRPNFVFHLAAQSLVKKSLEKPRNIRN